MEFTPSTPPRKVNPTGTTMSRCTVQSLFVAAGRASARVLSHGRAFSVIHHFVPSFLQRGSPADALSNKQAPTNL